MPEVHECVKLDSKRTVSCCNFTNLSKLFNRYISHVCTPFECIFLRRHSKYSNKMQHFLKYLKQLLWNVYLSPAQACHVNKVLNVYSVANTTAKPRNWATFDPAAAGKKLAPRFAINPIPVNVISMGWPEIGLLETLAPRFDNFLVGNTGSYRSSFRTGFV